MTKKENNVCVYHSKDNDGLMCSALMTHYYEPYPQNLFGYNYGESILPIEEAVKKTKNFGCLVFADVLPKPQEIIRLAVVVAEKGGKLVIFDHHQSSYNELIEYSNNLYESGRMDLNISFGSPYFCVQKTLLWANREGIKIEFYFGSTISASETLFVTKSEILDIDSYMLKSSPILNIVGQYDIHDSHFMYDKKHFEICITPINVGVASFDDETIKDFFYNLLFVSKSLVIEGSFVENPLFYFSEIGKTIMRNQQKEYQRLYENAAYLLVSGGMFTANLPKTQPIRTAIEAQIEGFDQLVMCICNTTHNPNFFAPPLNGDTPYQFIVCYYQKANGTWSYSLRFGAQQNHNLDLSKIAQAFGGGGHPKAAGFSSKHNIFDNV